MTLKIENGGKGQQRFKSMRRGKEGGGGVYIQLWFTQWKSTLSTHRV